MLYVSESDANKDIFSKIAILSSAVFLALLIYFFFFFPIELLFLPGTLHLSMSPYFREDHFL